MDIKLTPSKLQGSVKVPPSKSLSHRALICAALAGGESVVRNIVLSKDITATIDVMTALGAHFLVDGNTVTVHGIELPPALADLDCCESGSTLRFVIPIAAAFGVCATYYGRGKLPTRPITPYIRELSQKNVTFAYADTMPFNVAGMLRGGRFEMEGNISSQFISGLLFALPLLQEDSDIVLTSQLESKPYADMTVQCLRQFGISVKEHPHGYHIPGRQRYAPYAYDVEGDYSQAAFFLVANALGSSVALTSLNPNSIQGDREILAILDRVHNEESGALAPFDLDVGEIPDLVPILTVLGCFCKGQSVIRNASRLRIKECDRLEAMTTCLNAIGGKVAIVGDTLVIDGVDALRGGEVDSFNDHRIAMAMAIASTRCEQPLLIRNARCVEKSYPNFFEDFSMLGGTVNVVTLEP